jgi:hypothetical protein
MPIKLNSTGGGSITIDVPNMSTANTLTLPAITGNVITSADSNTVTQPMISRSGFYGGFGPVFSAANTTVSFSIPGATYYKVSFPVENFDTSNCYDPSLSRFTPNVAGYYHIGARLCTALYSGRWSLYLYKNGALFAVLDQNTGNGSNDEGVFGSGLVYANGTTDYFEIYVQGNNTTTFYGYTSGGQDFTFYAHLARPA